MPKASYIATAVLALTIAAVLFSPVVSTVNNNAGEQAVTNTTATADVGAYVDLPGFNVDKASETVYYDNGSSYKVATEGTDYEFNYSTASVKALSGGAIGDGDALKVSYDYQATSGVTTTIVELLPVFVALLGVVYAANRIQRMM